MPARLLVFHSPKSFGTITKVQYNFSTRIKLILVPLKNSDDYQYKINGTIYSLCMDECFREDEGIYTIRLASLAKKKLCEKNFRAVNDKGIDMCECQVKVVA